MVHLATELTSTPIGHPAPETASPPARHTPGPWRWHWRSEEGIATGTVYAMPREGHAYTVAVCPRYQSKKQWTDDASLIAAAPELLRCLQQLHDDIAEYARINNLDGYDNHVMRRARSAMALARGEAQTVSDDRDRADEQSVAR